MPKRHVIGLALDLLMPHVAVLVRLKPVQDIVLPGFDGITPGVSL